VFSECCGCQHHADTYTEALVEKASNRSQGSCAGWCTNLPEKSWKWYPLCKGCIAEDPSTGQDMPAWCRLVPQASRDKISLCSGSEGTAALPADDGGPEAQDLTVPKWCQAIPVLARTGLCKGGSCNCTDVCVNVPAGDQAQSPDCCGCGTVDWHEGEQPQVPAWCKYVPEQYRNDKCKPESHSCQCKDWCSAEPLSARAWTPECCGCSDDDAATVAPGNDDATTVAPRGTTTSGVHHDLAAQWTPTEDVDPIQLSGSWRPSSSALLFRTALLGLSTALLASVAPPVLQ